MSQAIKIGIEKTEDGFWSYVQRSPGVLPETPLFEFLTWILEQLNFGHFGYKFDDNGRVVSLKIGRDIPHSGTSLEDASENAKSRLLSVNIAGVMAVAREKGIEPEYETLSKEANLQITDGGRRNTEIHYAFELIKVLARLNKKTFKLEAPPIVGMAPRSVLAYLSEATRCWLYGFYGASVAMSRACLEASLKSALPSLGLADLSTLIQRADTSGKLDGCMKNVAHSIRRTGNKFLHGDEISELESRDALDGIRSIVSFLFSTQTLISSD